MLENKLQEKQATFFFFFSIKSKLQEDLKFNRVAEGQSFCNQSVK